MNIAMANRMLEKKIICISMISQVFCAKFIAIYSSGQCENRTAFLVNLGTLLKTKLLKVSIKNLIK